MNKIETTTRKKEKENNNTQATIGITTFLMLRLSIHRNEHYHTFIVAWASLCEIAFKTTSKKRKTVPSCSIQRKQQHKKERHCMIGVYHSI